MIHLWRNGRRPKQENDLRISSKPKKNWSHFQVFKLAKGGLEQSCAGSLIRRRWFGWSTGGTLISGCILQVDLAVESDMKALVVRFCRIFVIDCRYDMISPSKKLGLWIRGKTNMGNSMNSYWIPLSKSANFHSLQNQHLVEEITLKLQPECRWQFQTQTSTDFRIHS
jgi:hypothetical protein